MDENRRGRRAPGWAAEPQTNPGASDADARSFVSLSGRGEFDKIRSRIGVVERAPLEDKLVFRRIQRVQEGGQVLRGWRLRIGSRRPVLGEHCARQGRC